MKRPNILRLMTITLCFLMLFVLVNVHSGFAGSEDLIVTNVTRITPPDYRSSNNFYGVRDWAVWSKDNDRMMVVESSYDQHPVSGKYGRGIVWGAVMDFKNWTDTVDYESKVIPIKPAAKINGSAGNNNYTTGDGAIWSQTDNDVLYVATRGCNIYSYNVATDTYALVRANVYPSGQSCSGAYAYPIIKGWTGSGFDYPNRLMVMFKAGTETEQQMWDNHGVAFVSTSGAIYWDMTREGPESNQCSSFYRKLKVDWPSHGHGGASPSFIKYAMHYGFADQEGVWDLTDPACSIATDCGDGGACTEDLTYENQIFLSYPYYGVHTSWKASEDWFLANSDHGAAVTAWPTAPSIVDYKVYQVFFDGSNFIYHKLLTQGSAHRWDDGTHSVSNYQAHFISTLRKDGRQAIFTSTGGKYSKDDCQYYGSIACPGGWTSDTWGFEGFYLVDFELASGAQTCTSFTYTAWNECQPNGTQSRTVTSSSPSACTGGNPVLTQGCTYIPGASTYNILKTTGSPTIDGNLAEYALANPLTFSSSSGGNTITVKTLWNSEALYLGINVTDTQLNASVTTTDGSVWSDDSVEWFIDTYNDGGGSTNPNSAFMLPDDYHGIVNMLNAKYDSQGTTSSIPNGSWNGTWQAAVKLNGTNNVNTDNDTGYTIEIKIPWTSVGYSSAPSQDALIGMSFAINDKDATGTNSIMMSDITIGFENASNWQSVLLSGTAAFVDAVPPAPPMALMIQ